jgi:hypothetical protein
MIKSKFKKSSAKLLPFINFARLSGIALFAISFLIMLNLGSAFAMGETVTNPEYNPHTVIGDMNFSAYLTETGTVEMSWSEYAPAGFNYYKVIRSQTNQDPVYPDDSYIYGSGIGNVTYTDTNVPAGTSYYRVCSIVKPERYCSPVVIIKNESLTEQPLQQPNSNSTVIRLTGSANNDLGELVLSWAVDEPSKITNGFKVVYSKTNPQPVYPGDSYHYLTDSSSRSDKITDALPGYTYYIRVCQYDGAGKCLSYSNVIDLVLEGGVEGDKVFNFEKPFKDTEGHWAATYIENVKNKCQIYGYKDPYGNYLYEFGPDAEISRAAITQMLVQCTYGGSVSGVYESFEDVDPAAWYAAAIYKAKKLGWAEGYENGLFFKPTMKVNRAEALKLILLSVYNEAEITGGGSSFYDVLDGIWFKKYVDFAVKMAYVKGYSEKYFGPSKNITRGEVAKIISLVHGL